MTNPTQTSVGTSPGSAPGFWAGYRIWLGQNSRVLGLLVAILLVAFAIALWASHAPADPFAYGDFQ